MGIRRRAGFHSLRARALFSQTSGKRTSVLCVACAFLEPSLFLLHIGEELMVSYSGSVSDTPPSGPSVDPNASITDIQALIASCQSDFNSSQSTYSSLLAPYATLQSDVDSYLAGTMSASDLVTAYNNLVSQLSSITDAGTDLLNKSAALTTAIAYEQLLYAQTTLATIQSDADALLNTVSGTALSNLTSVLTSLSTLQRGISGGVGTSQI